MYNTPSPLTNPTLRDDLARYPPLLQMVKVATGTVPGPSGFTSASVQAALLYISSTQQLRTDTLFPRDREPCLALDINGWGLVPGYYLGRLAGNWNGLPVYECGFPPAYIGLLFSAGYTPEQVATILLNLTPGQLLSLSNLTPCQVQTLITGTSSIPSPKINIPTLQLLTGNLNPTQLFNLVGQLTPAQVGQLTSTLTIQQLINLTTALPSPQQIFSLVQGATPQQIAQLVGSATPTQLQSLTKYPPDTIQALINQSFNYLFGLVNTNPLPPSPLLGNQGVFPSIPQIVGRPSSSPNLAQGFGQLVSDQQGNLYVSTPSGSYVQIPIGSTTTTGPGIFTDTSSVTVTGTTAATTMAGTGSGSLTISGGSLVAGSVLRIRAGGTLSITGGQTVTIRSRYASATLGHGQLGSPATALNGRWEITAELVVRTAGASGSVNGTMSSVGFATSTAVQAGSGAPSMDCQRDSTSVDTTSSNAVDLTAQLSSGTDSITRDFLDLERIR